MKPAVIAFLARHHGLITFRQATELGLEAAEIGRMLRTGEWVRVRRGVYVDGEMWADLDEVTGRPLLRVRAAHLTLRVKHWFSHDSAALLHGMSLLHARETLVHVSRPAVRGDRTESGIKHHGAAFREDQATVVEGLPMLDLARTAVDVTREHGLTVGVGACDQAMRLGATRAELVEARAHVVLAADPHRP